MENRHDFTKMTFTLELFRHVLFKLVPDIIFHTQNQDEEQIRDNYDRASPLLCPTRSSFDRVAVTCFRPNTDDLLPFTGGDDFYGWFLSPRMIYTSGIVTDLTREETLEELQDNKLTVVCEKVC